MRPIVAVRATDRTVRASARSKEGETGGPTRFKCIGKTFSAANPRKSFWYRSSEAPTDSGARFSIASEKLVFFARLTIRPSHHHPLTARGTSRRPVPPIARWRARRPRARPGGHRGSPPARRPRRRPRARVAGPPRALEFQTTKGRIRSPRFGARSAGEWRSPPRPSPRTRTRAS